MRTNQEEDLIASDKYLLESQHQKLIYTTFMQRENERYHHTYDEELLQYEYVRDGDMRSIEESKRLFRTGISGKLSNDSLRDKKYLFVASITLATRFCIEGGMDAQEAYNISDLYIQQMDLCGSINEVYNLQTTMITDFTNKMSMLHSTNCVTNVATTSTYSTPSKPIQDSMDYIYYHLHEKITLQNLADVTSLTPTYLATLFRKEKGLTIQAYIRSQRIEAAKNMLLYSNYTLTEIGEFLSFSSSSHFIKIFRDQTGLTPKQFQQKYYRRHMKWAK